MNGEEETTSAHWLLIQSAWSLLRIRPCQNPLRRWAERLAEARGRKIAAVALVRELAGVLWTMTLRQWLAAGRGSGRPVSVAKSPRRGIGPCDGSFLSHAIHTLLALHAHGGGDRDFLWGSEAPDAQLPAESQPVDLLPVGAQVTRT